MGWGEFSDSVMIVAAKVPDEPPAPTTSIINIFVRVQWDEPYLNSSPIEAYEVYVADKDGNFVVENTYCNGAEEPVLSQRYCEIPMSVLRDADQYGMEFDMLVQAQVKARNQYGWSMISESNSDGARIQTQPSQVKDLTEDNLRTSEE